LNAVAMRRPAAPVASVRADDVTTVDFETEAIGPRPEWYPPLPVGVAIRWPDGRSEYLAWGHPDVCADGTPGGNNCTRDEAIRALRMAWKGPVLFHNGGGFDIEVAMQHLGLPWPKVWHDTLYLLFLHDPHALSLSLKPSAERLLNEPPYEQTTLHDWIVRFVPGVTKKTAGAHICKAPVHLVAPYAVGDVRRTFDLFKLLYPIVQDTQPRAYERELRLAPFLVAAERRGIRVDRDLLSQWEGELSAAVDRCDDLIRSRLNDTTLNVDADEELITALDREGLMNFWVCTDGTVENGQPSVDGQALPEGANPFGSGMSGTPVNSTKNSRKRRSVSKPALARGCSDPDLVNLLDYRNTAATMLRTFVLPWLQQSVHDGRLHTKWHQVRGQEKNGTRTGRIASSDPNLANVPNPNKIKPPAPGLPFLPSLRMALLPEEGCIWISVDYSQQELRITAHYEDGGMLIAYRTDARIDMHDYARKMIADLIGLTVDRKKVKTTAFAIIYGAGLEELARQMGVSMEEADSVRESYFRAVPGLRRLITDVKVKARTQGYITSAGGRRIKLEAPKLVKGKYKNFDYKMPNHLIQGTAADQTKQAIIDFCEAGYGSLFMGQVYDEINISVPAGEGVHAIIEFLVECMKHAIPLDTPMECDVEVGTSWGDLRAYSMEHQAVLGEIASA
jgi:DNA polymerase I-like protein with 3'-5' exonuclease and polymerase domains